MNNSTVHKIEQHTLVVQMENPPDAFEFKNKLAGVLHDSILPHMERLFDELAASNRLIRMDTLEIDVGTIEFNNWENSLTQAIIEGLKKSLVSQNPLWENQAVVSFNNGKLTAAHNYIKTQLIKNEKSTASQNENDVQLIHDVKSTASQNESDRQPKNELHTFEEIFLFYLKHNYLPWYVGSDYQLRLNFSSWLQAKPLALITQFLNNAAHIQLERFVYFAGIEGCQQVISFILSASLQSVNNLQRIANSMVALKLFFEKALIPAVDQPATLLRLLYLPFFKWISSNQLTLRSFHQKFVLLVAEQLAVNMPGIQVKKNRAYDIKDVIISKLEMALDTFNHQPLKKEMEPDVSVQSKDEMVDASYIANAGLVVLHLFLATLFQALLFTNENKFISVEAHMRAVVLTQYLVTGEPEYEDHLLLLNKLLCGYPLNKPVVSGIVLTAVELDEAAQLWQHCISLWTKNGVRVNPTAESLRSAFLLREGKVTCNNDYRLQVQQMPYDLVMSALPWGISIIKTPFMKVKLWVDWA